MSQVLVTGASGLVGANVCRLLIERGHTARALVRSRSGTEPLAAMGAELADGDVTDADSLRRAGSGMDAVVHSAALIGGPGQDRDAVWQVNAVGTRSVLDLVPDGRTVVIGTVDLYAGCSETIDEKTPFPGRGPEDPYSSAKRDGLVAAMERAARGQHVSAVMPGGIYGPSPMVRRSFSANSYNRVVRGAVRGKLPAYVAFPAAWAYVADVAMVVVRAVEDGVSGASYLALGRPEDVCTTAGMLNVACEVAGVPHRSRDVYITDANRAEIEKVFGPSLLELSERTYPDPYFDDTHTRAWLGVSPTPLREGLSHFIEWARQQAQVERAGDAQ
jgi:farnesol dehydrogenase